MKTCILLTACVNPGEMTLTAIKDKDEREKQYKEALNFYLEHTKAPIVFCENTLTDFSNEYRVFIASGRLEYITFDGNKYDKSRGKGYGEALIIKYAIENSAIIREYPMIVKITGRLICHNIRHILDKCNQADIIYTTQYSDSRKKILCDSRLVVAHRDYYLNDFLIGMEKLNDTNKYYFEHLLYDTAHDNKHSFKLKEIWFPIKIVGKSGSYGYEYSYNAFTSIKFYIHYFLHRIGYFGPLFFR